MPTLDEPATDAQVWIARFSELSGLASSFPDNPVPGCARITYPVIGFQYDPVIGPSGSAVRPPVALAAAIPISEGVSICFVSASPGHGTLFHRHVVNETFVCMSGEWECFWRTGDGAEKSAILGHHDTCAISAGVARRFECRARPTGGGEALLMAIVLSSAPKAAFTEDALRRIAKAAG